MLSMKRLACNYTVFKNLCLYLAKYQLWLWNMLFTLHIYPNDRLFCTILPLWLLTLVKEQITAWTNIWSQPFRKCLPFVTNQIMIFYPFDIKISALFQLTLYIFLYPMAQHFLIQQLITLWVILLLIDIRDEESWYFAMLFSCHTVLCLLFSLLWVHIWFVPSSSLCSIWE